MTSDPQTPTGSPLTGVWSELVGQEKAVAVLRRAVAGQAHAMSHAWLLTGPPGSGRSNAARAFGALQGGCGVCNDCRTAVSGAHPDVTLVRTETLSIGVDEVRQLVLRAAMSPSRGRRQVVVVEDADRITERGADALLKAIEEPAERTVWVLCAPTPDDVIVTIRSRCRRLHLATPRDRAVAELLADRDGVSDQLSAYATGHSGYSRGITAELLAESHARAQAAGALGAAAVLGSGVAASTPMRRVRLVGLGARVSRSDDDGSSVEGPVTVTTDIFLGDVDSAVVVALRTRTHQPSEDAPHSTAGNRAGGVRIGDLARGSLVTESASRSVARMLSLANSRVAKTTVTTPPQIWARALPPGLVVSDYSEALEQLAARSFRLVRPRVTAESVRAVEVAEVGPIGYSPGDQLLTADVTDADGHRAQVVARYRPAAPAGLDALATALASGHQMISAVLGRRSGRLLIDPLAVATPDGIVVPDLTEGGDADALMHGAPDPGDELDRALAAAADLMADAAHAGLRHVGGAFPGRVVSACERLHRIGLHRLAADLDALRGPDPGAAWVRAELRLLATIDVR